MTIQIKQFVYWIFKLIVIASAIGFLLFLFNMIFYLDLDTHNIEKTILIPRIISSVQYQDPYTRRQYYYIVDPSKFNQNNFDLYFNSTHYKDYAFMAVLYDLDNNKIADEIYYNKDFYDYAQPLTYSKHFEQYNVTRYVLTKQDKQFKSAVLKTIFVFKAK